MIGETEILTAHPARLQGGAEARIPPRPWPSHLPPPLHPVPLPPSSQEDVLLAPSPAPGPVPREKLPTSLQYQFFPGTVVTPLLNVESLGLKVSQMGGVAQ